MLLDVSFIGRQPVDLLQALVGRPEVLLFHHHHTEVVVALDVARVNLQDAPVGFLGHVQVLDMIGVDVAQQNESLDVFRKVLEKLVLQIQIQIENAIEGYLYVTESVYKQNAIR